MIYRLPDFALHIMRQYGGGEFLAVTGAKNLTFSEKGKYVVFQLPKNPKGVKYVKTTLMPEDVYSVEFLDYKMKRIDILEPVYWEELTDRFEEETGLYALLYPRN